MKKLKEFILLLVLFFVSFILFFVVYQPSPFLVGSDNAFVGGINYLKLLLNDKTFYMAIFNTIRKPFVSSVVLIPLSCFILKKRIIFTRKSFYLTSFFTSLIISIVYLITNVALYNLLGYIFLPMFIVSSSLIVFWAFEFIIEIIKKLIEGKFNEKTKYN